MILLFVVWSITFSLTIPYGFVISKLLHSLLKEKNKTSIIECFFLGIAGITSLVCCINYFYPIHTIILSVLCIGSISIFVFHSKAIISLLKSSIHQFLFELTFSRLVLFIFLILGISVYSLSTPVSYDMDLYHLQYMQWITEYKVIPGLGNLHGRFAFNSTFLLLCSLFYNFKSFFYLFPINELISFVTLGAIFSNWNKRTNSVNIICVLIFSLYIILFGQSLSSTSTDFSVNLIVLYLFLYVSDIQNRITSYSFGYILILSMFCVTLKISCLLILLLPLYLFIRYRKLTFSRRSLTVVTLILVIVVLPWIGRYIILSGYLIYPFDKIDVFGFDWKIPLQLVHAEKIDAYAWARIPFQDTITTSNMSFSRWFPIWIANLGLFKQIIFVLAFVSPIFIIILVIAKKIDKLRFVIWSIGIAGTIYLLFTAPDLRFTSSFVLIAGFIPLLIILESNNWFRKIGTPILVCSLLVLLIYLNNIALGQIKLYQPLSNKSVNSLLIVPQTYGIKNDNEQFQKSEDQQMVFFYPTLSNKCYDHYLPCSPYFNENLHFRGDKIEDGFIIKERE